MTLYKITDADGYTRRGEENETRWGAGVTHEAAGSGNSLCSADLIHAYEDPLIAAFMHPGHIDHSNSVLWEAEGEVVARNGQTKCGVKRLTTLKVVRMPAISTEKRVEIAIRCALTCYKNAGFVRWAKAWLDGSDRSRTAEAADGRAACRAEWSAAAALAAAAAERAAERAAEWAAEWAELAAAAAEAAVEAAAAAEWAELAAAAVEAAAADAEPNGLDLLSIIRKVVKI